MEIERYKGYPCQATHTHFQKEFFYSSHPDAEGAAFLMDSTADALQGIWDNKASQDPAIL